MTSRHRRRLADRIQVGPRRHADRGRQRWRLVRGYMHRQASSLQSPSAQRRSHPCTAALSTTYDRELQPISVVQASNFIVGWRGGAMVGRRTCDQEVASSIPGRARLRNDSGQVVHTQLPRRWHSSLVYRVVKLGIFTLFAISDDSDFVRWSVSCYKLYTYSKIFALWLFKVSRCTIHSWTHSIALSTRLYRSRSCRYTEKFAVYAAVAQFHAVLTVANRYSFDVLSYTIKPRSYTHLP